MVVITGVEVRNGKPDQQGQVRQFRQVTAVGIEGDGGGLMPVTVQVPEKLPMPEQGQFGRLVVEAVGGMRVVGQNRNYAVPTVEALRLVEFVAERAPVAGAK